ncbi:MAG: DUF1735 and LamG domain-containing protein [Mangrovibacterium sp.]
MIQKYFKISFAVAALALFASCEQGYEPMGNAVYFGEAQTGDSKTVTVKKDGATATLYTSVASPLTTDVTANIVVDEQALADYNKKHGTNYLLLPESYYEFSNSQCVIEAGKISSDVVNVNINAFDDNLEVSEKYAIPVKIASASGADILAPSGQMMILCDKIISTKVMMASGGATGASPTYSHVVQDGDLLTDDLYTWTVEYLLYCTSLSQNKHILRFNNAAGTVTLFMRLGQDARPINEFQATLLNAPYYATTTFEAKKWYHIAYTCDGTTIRLYVDGVLDLTVDHPVAGTNITWRSFSWAIGNPGALAEARIWNTVRTRAEIESNMYAVNPNTEGLISYWKMDDGVSTSVGTLIKDYTGNGRDLTIKRAGTSWVDQDFPPEY